MGASANYFKGLFYDVCINHVLFPVSVSQHSRVGWLLGKCLGNVSSSVWIRHLRAFAALASLQVFPGVRGERAWSMLKQESADVNGGE